MWERKGSQKMLSHTRSGSVGEVATSRLGLLGKIAAGAAVLLALSAGCSSSPSTPPGATSAPLVTCGNGVIDAMEQCDGNVGAVTCAIATMGAAPYGTLACSPSNCQFDTMGCSATPGGPPPSMTSTAPPPTGGAGVPVNQPPPSGNGGVTASGTGGGPSGGDGTIPPIGGGGTTAGGGATGAAGAGMPAPMGAMDPIIPMVSGDCPTWANGTITFMGLAGIQIAAGAKPADASAPMLIYWHGTGSTSGEYAFMAAAVANGVTAAGGVIVSFQGTTGGDLYSGTNIFGASDLKLIDQLVACAVKDHNIDPRKIYVTGCSAGGLMSIATAALRSNYIAAAASNSGGVTVPPAFENAHVPPIMTVHGKMGSDVVIIDFASASASADTLFKGKGGFTIDCDTGGGHCGGAGLAGDVWKFFQAHPFGVSPEPWAMALPPGFSTQCMIK